MCYNNNMNNCVGIINRVMFSSEIYLFKNRNLSEIKNVSKPKTSKIIYIVK